MTSHISILVIGCLWFCTIPFTSQAKWSKVDTAQAAVLLSAYLDSANALEHTKTIKSFEYNLKALDLEPFLVGHRALKSRLHNMVGNALGAHGVYAESSQHKHLANYYLRTMAKPDSMEIGFTFGGIGSFYLRDSQIDSAFKAFRMAYHVMKKLNTPLYESSACNNLALAHQESQNFDSASFYYQKALSIVEKGERNGNNRRFKEVLYLNYGELLAKMGEYERSNKVFLKVIDSLNLEKQDFRDNKKIVGFFQIAQNYLSLQKWDLGAAYVDSFSSLSGLYEPIIVDKIWYGKLLEQQLKLSRALGKGNLPELLSNLNETRSEIIKLQAAEVDKKVAALDGYRLAMVKKQKAIHELEVLRKENELQLSERNNQLNLLIFLVAGSVILSIVLVAFFFFKRKSEMLQMEQQRAALELENKRLQEEKLQIELKAKEEDVLKLSLENNRKREWNSEVIQKLKVLKKENGEDHQLVLRKIEMELRDELYSNEKVDLIHKNIDQINQAFYDKLKARFTDLTQGEMELCGLIKMRLNGKEIAKLRGISPQSVTKSKQRLRKKLNLDASTDIAEILEDIS